MTDPYIDPEDALGPLTIQPKKVDVEDLGPNPPHDFDEELEEGKTLAFPVLKVASKGGRATPGLALNPGPPPIVGEPHYTNVLDELWAEFDDPEERTAARLLALHEEVSDEAFKVYKLAQDVWENLPAHKVPDSSKEQYDREFLAYTRRLLKYREILEELEPDSTATDSVYVGLVKRRQGAGPVPDAIMHMYFAKQLGILSEHANDMSEGFMGRVIDGLVQAGDAVHEAAKNAADSKEATEEKLASWWQKLTRPWLWAGGIFVGSLVAIGGTVAIIKASKSGDE